MQEIQPLSSTLLKIIKDVDSFTNSKPSNKNLGLVEYLINNSTTIKSELNNYTSVAEIKQFTQKVPVILLDYDVFPAFVWNDSEFSKEIPLKQETYAKFSEDVRANLDALVPTLRHEIIINEDLATLIPNKLLEDKDKVLNIIGEFELIIPHIDKSLWNDKDFVNTVLFDDSLPNRKNFNEFGYIAVLKMLPERVIDDEMAEKITQKFQMGYIHLPEEFKLKPQNAIYALENHLCNIEAIPEALLENPDVVMAAVNATSLLDDFISHPYDEYQPFYHLEPLYNSKMFQLLNVFKIEPLRIPGNSQEFKKIIEDEYVKMKLSMEVKPEVKSIPTPKPNYNN